MMPAPSHPSNIGVVGVLGGERRGQPTPDSVALPAAAERPGSAGAPRAQDGDAPVGEGAPCVEDFAVR